MGSTGFAHQVLEGDVRVESDADRLASLHIRSPSSTPTPLRRRSSLDANMVRSALPALPLHDIDLLMPCERGNLVCPAEFHVGEDARRDGLLGDRG